MGNGAPMGRKKQNPLPEKDPLRKATEVLSSLPAKERVISALKLIPPGISNRWDKILIMINRREEATEENPDPLRIEINFQELKTILNQLYEDVRYISSDGLALSRTFLPKIYDEHQYDKMYNLSKIERNSKYLSDPSFAYGEIDYDIFATMYLKIISVYGQKPEKGIFYDLGCGVGNLVYTAAFIGNFERVIGIEFITSLLERGERRLTRWNTYKKQFNNKLQEILIDFMEDDFLKNDSWSNDGSFIFIHWTTFTLQSRQKVIEHLLKCQEGTHIITFTKPIEHELFILLCSDTCDTSWGKAQFFFHEKVIKPVQ